MPVSLNMLKTKLNCF